MRKNTRDTQEIKNLLQTRKFARLKTVAKLLDISPRTINQWVYLKKVPTSIYYKVNGIILFDLQKLERWIENK